MVLKALRYEEARTSRTTDDDYKLVETHAVVSGLTGTPKLRRRALSFTTKDYYKEPRRCQLQAPKTTTP